MRTQAARVVGLVTGGHLLSHFYLLAFPPLFPLLRADLGPTNVELGLVMSAVGLGTVLQFPVDELVDRTGAKRVFAAGLVVTGGGVALAALIGGAVLAVVVTVVAPLGSLFTVAGVGATGAAVGLVYPSRDRLVSRTTSAGGTRRAFGFVLSGYAVGSVVGPAVLGWTVDTGGAVVAFLGVAALASAASAALALPVRGD